MTSIATQALDKVLLLSALISADMARFERESGLTSARVRLLWTLGSIGPCTQHSLANAMDVTPRNVTGLIDALVHSGHVVRERHPSDRRAFLVTPTRLGERAIDELQRGHQELAGQLFGSVPEQSLASFVATLDDTIAALTALIEADS